MGASVVLAFLVVGCALAYLWFFRAEGLMAFYVGGIPLLWFVVEWFQIPWTTEMTGAVYPIVFIPCIIWWQLSAKDLADVERPRRWGYAVWIVLALCVFWEIKRLYEGGFSETVERVRVLQAPLRRNGMGMAVPPGSDHAAFARTGCGDCSWGSECWGSPWPPCS